VTDAAPLAAPARSSRPTDVVVGAVLAVALVVGGVVALGLTGGDDDGLAASPGAAPTGEAPGAPEPAPTSTGEPAAPTGGACTYTEQGPAAKDVGLPPVEPLPVAGRTATLETSAGTITLRLSPSAPCTTSSFAFLAGEGYFDDTPCHRLTTEGIYVLQCGDPSGTGSGGPGYRYDDEALEGATYPAGTVAMANSGPGTNGSQFFLVYEDTELPPSYTPWARVTGGLDVLRAIADKGVRGGGGDGEPAEAVTLASVRVG
jgi:peptidyl-prolyl cis-trans isomerase B (cyclophilin B)